MKIEKLSERVVFSDKTFTKRILYNEEKVLNFVLNLAPGQEIPPHQHEESDLILHVLTGEGVLTVDGAAQPVETGDVVHCSGKEVFSLKNSSSENLSCFVVIAPRPGVKAYSEPIE
jgi:quercetin dioxygenase-like cupin family protein